MNLILDTSVWVSHLRHDALAPVLSKIRDRYLLWFTSVTAAELLAGCRSKTERRVVSPLLKPFEHRTLTPGHADYVRAATALSRLRESARSLSNPGAALLDGLQAAVAGRIGALIVTENLRDFHALHAHIPVRVASLSEFQGRG